MVHASCGFHMLTNVYDGICRCVGVGRAFTPLVVGAPSLLTAVLSPRSSLLTLTRGKGGGGYVTYLAPIGHGR